MTKENEMKSIPKLRFPGFEREWDEKRLGELCATFKSGLGITSERINKTGDYPVYGGNGLRGFTDTFTHDGYYVLIGRQGALCGNINRAKGKAYISEHAIVACANESADTEWLAQKLDYLKLNRLSESSAQPGLAVNKLVKLKFFVPSTSEQQKIASSLSAVDQKIQQLIRKKELLEQYKKGVMQKIFSREIRFQDDNGKDYPDWEETRGKNLFINHSNKKHDGDLPVLAATQDKGMVCRDTIGIEIKSSEESVRSYKIVEPGDFVISLRSFQGGIEYSYIKGICSPAYIILKPKIEIDDQFFKYYFKKEDFITRLSKTVVGIRDGKQITYDAFSGLKLQVPSVKEQIKISSFLNTLQEKTDLISIELGKTQAFKKGLLQRMFV